MRCFIWRCTAIYLVLLVAGCQQEMADQPRHEPLEASTFFADGYSSRHLVPGTVARGWLQLETPLYTGKTAGAMASTVPLPVTPELLVLGQERYNIFCTPCHDQVGTGQGMIVRRGYPRPPSLHIPRLRQAPVGHLFVVMSAGYGAMPEYGYLMTPPERWAVAAYIRALQLSQYAPVAELPAPVREQLPH